MSKYREKIARIEEKVAQDQQRLRDLKSRETAERRRNDTRRKILYGAAILSLIDTLPEDKKEDFLRRIHRHIHKEKDRTFLELEEPLEEESAEHDDSGPLQGLLDLTE
ncbi:hypothetical protein LR948_12150 [Roseivivax sp. GX 12232]|uniref:hypothetical protein n=1 Tax=Roseivivax sp. GX 12232 TaxID=2900547 RepID=UPI001E59243B|nr:hypothetical protein [Roseivivax sp. GX 12232]MCE0506113.1 hypothetical protein [Roseivivax sp. GX 12232]